MIRTEERRAGQLSDGEVRFCRQLRQFLRTSIDSKKPFAAVVRGVQLELQALRPYHFDVDEAISSGHYVPMLIASAADVPAAGSSPLSDTEREFLLDVDGFLDFAARNALDFEKVLFTLGPDFGELSAHEGSLTKTLNDHILPHVTGWALRNATPVGDPED